MNFACASLTLVGGQGNNCVPFSGRPERTDERDEFHCGRAGGRSIVPVDFPPVAHGQQVDHVPLRVEGVDDSIIPHAQPKTIMPLQAVMRKGFEPESQVINLRFEARPDLGREFEEGRVETGVVDLQRRAHGGSGLARPGAKSFGQLALGLLDGGLEFGCEPQIVLDQVVQPVAHLPQFGLRKFFQFGFDLGHVAHAGTVPQSRENFKLRWVRGQSERAGVTNFVAGGRADLSGGNLGPRDGRSVIRGASIRNRPKPDRRKSGS